MNEDKYKDNDTDKDKDLDDFENFGAGLRFIGF